MYKNATVLEKVLIVVMSLSLLGFGFFKHGTIREVFNYSLQISILFILISQTIRTWYLATSITKTLFLSSILLLIAGIILSELINREAGVILFLVAAVVHGFVFDGLLKKLAAGHKIVNR